VLSSNPSIGAHSWVRKSFNIAMEGEQTDYVWGVTDLIPDTDFPDIRNKCIIHLNRETCMIIPREGNKVRLYSIQLTWSVWLLLLLSNAIGKRSSSRLIEDCKPIQQWLPNSTYKRLPDRNSFPWSDRDTSSISERSIVRCSWARKLSTCWSARNER